MYRGQKSTAEKIVYDALDNINKKTGNDPVQVFMDAIDAVKPAVEVRSRRVGGATYQVPMEIREVRRLSLAIKWLITYSRKRSEKTVSERVAGEILDAINNRGGAVKKREDTHKMADANKAFAHYRW
jgi:small subunit ribosomal protein S7